MKATSQDRFRSGAETRGRITAPIVILAEAGDGAAGADMAAVVKMSDRDGAVAEADDEFRLRMASSCGDSEGCAGNGAHPSQLPASACSDLLHDISNLMAAMLLNAQRLDWKLPPYSHLKRPVRELARNAQRSSELIRRLQRHCGERCLAEEPQFSPAPANISSQSSNFAEERADVYVSPSLYQTEDDLTLACDRRTSDDFPKRDDSDGALLDDGGSAASRAPKRGN